VDGVLLIDKPAGITSHDVVAAVRSALGGVRTGHAGTLDPFATGLLLVLVGRATKSQNVLMGLPKRYETEAQLGALSSTGDPEGEITVTGRVPPDPPSLPTGEVRQRPPVYPEPRGEDVQMPERIVTVHSFRQTWRRVGEGPGDLPRAAFEIECGSGTYVRSLIADLKDGYCVTLRRTAIGPFEVADAVAPPPRAPRGQDAPAWLDPPIVPLDRALDALSK
jgi:tRNA pseudouridine55 synthase